LGDEQTAAVEMVGDIGGGGALAKIERGRKIMRETKSERSQVDELVVSINSLQRLSKASGVHIALWNLWSLNVDR